ncbi:MAG TPA: hypothetical protein VH297_11850 [Gaiellaceae bacterium]|jgi:hypothetical protein
MDHSDFPWSPLGRVLVDDGLLTPLQLERALAEQRRSGRLLGQVLVAQGQVTGTELTRALARQHGVEVRAGATADRVDQPQVHGTWRSLGMLLTEKGLVSPMGLQRALTEQREHPERPLGEILVASGSISPATLASVLAEQHGVTLETELVPAEAAQAPGASGLTYAVFAVDGAAAERRELRAATNFLDAADAACDYIDERLPLAVEIERQGAGRTEVVWTYSRERAAAAASSSKTLVETYGFDPTR